MDVALATALQFSHDLEPEGSYFMPEIMGSGAALLDYDLDGRLDVLLVNGRWGDGPQSARMQNRLYRQAEEGRFVDVTEAAGLEETTGFGVGVAVGDIDSDGDPDLYISCFGPGRVFRNNGDGTFRDSPELIQPPSRRWGTAAAFCDYNRDGWLDLFVVNYLDYFPGTQCDEGTLRLDYCGPRSFEGTAAKLYRHRGGPGTDGAVYEDVTSEAGLAASPGPGLGLICRDFNGDGRLDFYVANDQAANRLWLQQADHTFQDEAVVRGVAYNGLGHAQASMGVVSGDLSGDGLFDIFITNLRGESNILYVGQPAGDYLDGTATAGIAAPSLAYTGFGVVGVDLELDGDLDLVVVNGRVRRGEPLASSSLGPYWNDYAEPGLVLRNDGSGHFTDASAKAGLLCSRPEVSRALVAGDVDEDGDLDLLVTNCSSPARLYRNDTPRAGHWLLVWLIDPGPNRAAYGAAVEVLAGEKTWRRELQPSTSYLSSHDPRLHFGIGGSGEYDRIVVTWPDGGREEFPAGAADRQLILRRSTGRVLEGPP